MERRNESHRCAAVGAVLRAGVVTLRRGLSGADRTEALAAAGPHAWRGLLGNGLCMAAAMVKRPRPICPECGSADVVVGSKTGKCNRCGEMFQTERGFNYPLSLGEGMQRSSVDDVNRKFT